MEHYKNAQKKAAWRILFGIVESDLKKAQDDFITVLDDCPNSKYVEDAHFYYIGTLMKNYRYDKEFLKETEEEFDKFFDEFLRNKWSGQVRILFAKFQLLKKINYSKAIELLSDIIDLYRDTELLQEVEALLEYAQNIER